MRSKIETTDTIEGKLENGDAIPSSIDGGGEAFTMAKLNFNHNRTGATGIGINSGSLVWGHRSNFVTEGKNLNRLQAMMFRSKDEA